MIGSIAVIMAGLGVSYIGLKISQFSLATRYSRSWVKAQINPIRAEIVKQNIQLLSIPLSAWKELSMGYERLSSKFSLKGIEVGVVKSVFNEPLILVGKSISIVDKKHYAMVVKLDEVEIAYFGERTKVMVYVNEGFVGEIIRDKEYHIKNMVFEIEESSSEYTNLNYNGKHLMRLINKNYVTKPETTRLIEYIDEATEDVFVRAMPLLVYYLLDK
jgi:hypothetical protein